MSKVQVEVYFTDKLESIRVNQWQMEIPNAIRKNQWLNGLNRRPAG